MYGIMIVYKFNQGVLTLFFDTYEDREEAMSDMYRAIINGSVDRYFGVGGTEVIIRGSEILYATATASPPEMPKDSEHVTSLN